ncbi:MULTISPECIES: TonB-dependent receptor [unclassified Iodidimonas]|uniref:TonB-dependent receptor domain-containing protein n=1 Tax=unclassified Iodidimonas TaxID=2626145 RepID=UPI002482654C|nr:MULTISPECIES: TonB-dependent receptor [unclassified Iodidimonas]
MSCTLPLLAMSAGASFAQANEKSSDFQIPTQSLSAALDEFSRQADMDVLMPADVLEGQIAKSVKGSMSAREALIQLLQGSGLDFEIDQYGTVIIRSRTAESAWLNNFSDGVMTVNNVQESQRVQTAQASQPQASSGVQQSASIPLDEIIVTGSRIARAGFDTVQPAVTMNAEFMQDRGYVDLITAFDENPAFGASQNDAGEGGAELIGVNFANVFGIGSSRTLTVINGRRVVSSNTPTTSVGSGLGGVSPGLQVDLNTIPTLLVERAETIFTGGAPIYGTDAIGGTVNLILKKDFEGLVADAQYGIDQRGDAEEFTVRGLWGVNSENGKGNITVSLEYTTKPGLEPRDSAFAANAYGFCDNPNSTGPNDGVPDRRLCQDGFNRFVNPNTALPLLLLDNNGQPNASRLFDEDGNVVSTFVTDGFNSPNLLRNANGAPLIFDTMGNLITFDQANLGSDIGSQGSTSTIGANGFTNPIVTDLAAFNPILTPKDRWNLFATGRYEFMEDTEWFFEGQFSRVEANNVVTRPRNVTDAFGNNQLRPGIAININDNPFLTDQAKAILAQNGSYDPDLVDANGDPVPQFFKVNRSNLDVNGDRPTDFREQDVFRFVSGFEGGLEVFGRDWSWDAAFIYGESNAIGTAIGIDAQRFNFALDAVIDPDTGLPACRVQVEGFDPGFNAQPGSSRNTAVNECIPFNPFGFNPLTPEQEEFLLQPERRVTENRQLVYEVNLGGDLLDLPAGPLAVYMGAAHRRERGSFEGDRTSRNALTESSPIFDVEGKFNTTELYAEGLIPIIQDGVGLPWEMNFIRSLELEGAVRLVDNNLTGNDVTWTMGGRLVPDLPFLGTGLMLRGNFTQSIRAPSVAELFLPRQEVRTLASDPCDRDNITGGPNPATRQANCQAAAPGGFNLAEFDALIEDQRQLAISGGNPNLRPEKSDSWTVGGILTPGFLPGLELSIDWTNITVNDAIEVLDATSILNACFDSANFPGAAACDRFERGSDFQISRLETGFVNAAQLRFSGLVSNIRYLFAASDLPFLDNAPGEFEIFGNFFHVSKLERSIGADDLDIMAGEQFNEKVKYQLNMRYNSGPFMLMWQTRHLGGFRFDAQESEEFRSPEESKVPSMRIHNLTLAYDITENITARAVINNVFDNRDGPLRFAQAFSRDMTFSDAIGRRVLLGLNLAF